MRLVTAIIGIGLAAASLRAEPKPLAEAAESMAGKLGAGCIVTGESIDGKVAFALAGKGLDALPPEQHVFEIGSISKVFTGLLLAQTVLEGKASFNTTLRDLLGDDFGFADPLAAMITLEQLSTHTSGLPRLPDNMGPNPDGNPDPYAKYDREALHDFLRRVKLPGPPPHAAAYSNLGAGLLGDLLASLHGVPWERLVIDRIATPLGLTDTKVSLDASMKQRLAPPHRGDKTSTNWHFQALAGAGALRSTAADMIRFGQALIDPESTPFPEAVRLMMKPRTAFSGPNSQIGLGIIQGSFLRQPAWEHNGGTGGYRTALQVLPESKTVRVILINNTALPPETLYAALDPAAKPRQRVEQPLAKEKIAEYTGIFELSPEAAFTLIERDGELWSRLTGQPFFRLFYSGSDRFFLRVVPAEMQFERSGGAITSVTLFQNGRELRAAKAQKPPPKLLFRPAAELEPFTGRYELAPGRVFTVSINASTLFIELTGQPALPVFETRPGHFEYDTVDAAVEFATDDTGAVIALVLHQNGVHIAPRQTEKP